MHSLKHNRISRFLLAISLTFVFLSACNPFVNDLSKNYVPGTEAAYETTGSPGTLAKHLLSSRNFSSLVVEIQPVFGCLPYQGAINFLYTFLTSHLDKPGGIQIVVDDPIDPPHRPGGQVGYTLADLKKIEAANRKHYTKKGTLAVYILYSDWESNDDVPNGNVLLGQAYQSSSIVIFKSTIGTHIGAAAYPYVFEATILEHEFGHLLGLVNENGQGSSHEDPASPRHCKNPACLMAATIETSLTSALNAPPGLDADCEIDLKALRAD